MDDSEIFNCTTYVYLSMSPEGWEESIIPQTDASNCPPTWQKPVKNEILISHSKLSLRYHFIITKFYS